MGEEQYRAAAAALALGRQKTVDGASKVAQKREEVAATPPPSTPKARRAALPNANTVRDWLDDAIRDHVSPMHSRSQWNNADRGIAKRLLDEWGADRVKLAVDKFCSEWRSMVERSRSEYIRGLPTIRILMRFREQIFGEILLVEQGVDLRKKTNQEREREAALRGEYRNEDGSVNVPKIKSW